MKIRAIITGATGMVGEGVMHECLNNSDIEKVLIINRRPSGFSHLKLEEIIHKDFQDISSIEDQLKGYNACFFCLGVSSVGMNEEKFSKLTYDLTLGFASTLVKVNPEMTFTYISGAGTGSSEKGKTMWARVKGKTENDLLKLGFKDAYMFRPGYMQPTDGLQNTLKYYKYVGWLYPVLRAIFPKYVSTLSELGQAMIHVVLHGSDKKLIEVRDIVNLAVISK